MPVKGFRDIQHPKTQKSPTREGEAVPHSVEPAYLILMKIVANVNRVRDSMNARPRISRS